MNSGRCLSAPLARAWVWVVVACGLLAGGDVAAQALSKSAIQVDAGNTKQTGQTFGYRLTYNCSSTSGPCVGAQVIDLLPAEVQYISTVPASPTGDVAAINVTNNFGGTGRTRVQFVLINPLPAGNSGDLLINVRFPNGSTPNGTVATNTADGINLGATPGTLTTPPVNVTAVASVQATLQKTLQTSPANLDLPESYRLRITVPNNPGALNLTSIGPVTDTLPPGTVFNGATPAADCQPGCVGTTPATVTWTAPCSVPLGPNNSCDIAVNVIFPSATFPSGSNVTNSFTADITPLGQPPQTVGPGSVTHPVTTFVPAPGAGFSKNMAANTPNPPTLNQTFSYDINVSNSGNVPLDNLVIVDTLPVELQLLSVTTGSYSGLADVAAGVGVRVSYEKNTAPGVFTLWGSSPNTGTNTTLTSPPPGLGAGEYLTRVRWELGQASAGMAASTRPLLTGRIVNPDNAGGPTAIGDTISNCATFAAVYNAGPTNVTRSDCENFNVSGPFTQLNPQKENLSGGGPFNPGQAVSWRLRVRTASQSSDPVALDALTVTDLLPVDLAFTGWTFDDQGTGLPAPQSFEQIPNFAGTGRTLLRWRWNAGSGNLGVNQQVWVNITTSIRSGAASGALSNTMNIDSDAPSLGQRCSGSSAADALDLDGDGNTAESVCTASGSINVAGIAQLVSGKTIRAVCDADFGSSSDGTLLGGSLDYRLRVQNVGTVAMRDVVLIDILPHVGDTGVRDTAPRGSQWTPLLAAPILPPAGTTISYSTSGNPCRGEVGGPTTGCDAPNWSTVPPSPISSVRAFKVEFGDRDIGPFDFLEFRFAMVTPAGVSAGLMTYNSFAYQAERGDGLGALAAEPQKIGTELGLCEAAALGDYVWVDENRDGVQNDGDTGLDGVYVELFDNGPDGIAGTPDDGLVASTVTMPGPGGDAGWYRFPGLDPGTYRVCFHPPATYAPTARGIGADITLDSDADALTLCTDPVPLANNEDRPDIDLGLLPPDPAALGNYVWFDRNGDGVQNESPFDGINGIGVRLFLDDGDGVPGTGADALLATTVTSDDVYGRPGYYVFDGLQPNRPYFVQFVLPPTATGFTIANAGGDDGIDSDATPAGYSGIAAPGPGEFDPTLDAGLVLPTGALALGNQVWRDTNNNGLFEPQDGELGIDGVRLRLYRDASNDGAAQLDEYVGATVSGTVAGFAGRYRFDGLAAGNYIVVVDTAASPALDGLSTSTGNDPAPDPDDDVDGDDNGAQLGALVASRPVTLSANGEPTSEDGDSNSNLTVDFGFFPTAPEAYDYGDAPDTFVGTGPGNYNTLALDGGAVHRLGVPGAPFLGACVDGDDGTAQGISARGDDLAASGFTVGTCAAGAGDEDGVVIANPLQPGLAASFTVSSGGPAACVLDAWVDWNGNGVFDDAGEAIASGLTVPTGPATVLTPTVPANAKPGITYARFRCSSFGGLSPVGVAADGEVEDHRVSILGRDFGDAPASYGTSGAGAASHLVDATDAVYLGQCVDTDADGAPSAGADGDDLLAGSTTIGAIGCTEDEDGVVFLTPLSACQASDINVFLAGSAPAQLDGWIDFNADGDFADAGEQVFASQALLPGAQPLGVDVPCAAAEGTSYARFRVSRDGALASTGEAPDGEVEDYVVSIGAVDFGDAPDSYGTLFASGGPFHGIVGGFSLGTTVDGEPDGQPSVAADGDGADEDGIVFAPGPFIACGATSLDVTLTNTAGVATPQLDAWIDWDADGSFDEPRDRIASGDALVSGNNVIAVAVPCDVASAASYARFRLSSDGVATSGDVSVDGEVEDYAVIVRGTDFGDAPVSYATLRADDGARHLVLPGFSLGADVDAEADGQPSVNADGDGADENGVVLPERFVACKVGVVQVQLTNTAAVATPLLDAWIDWAGDGSFDAGDRVASGVALVAGVNSFDVDVPCDAQERTTYARFRLSSTGTDVPTGELADGEVEDYLIGSSGLDFGDAPASYGTLFADNGARHAVTPGYTLGATVDTEADGQPNADATGDGSDEDGVTLPARFVACGLSTIDVSLIDTAAVGSGRLDAWLDWDADGTFDTPRDRIATAVVLADGANTLTVATPCDAAPGTTFARFRLSAAGFDSPLGSGGTGEIEDHVVSVSGLDFGDAPDSYATLLASDGARHAIVPGFALGAGVDHEPDGQPTVAADGDGADEDGVVFPGPLVACSTASLAITLDNGAALADARLDAWIDWNADGSFDDPSDRIASAIALADGANTLSVSVPCGLASITTYARFRLSTGGIDMPTGIANNGEIEDHAVALQGLDLGDAQGPGFATLLVDDGARHVLLPVGNPVLGAIVDADLDGQPSALADGDDTHGSDDEDGVTFTDVLSPGLPGSVTVTTATGGDLSAWIDFNRDGTWTADEQIASGNTLPIGSTTLTFPVPAGAVQGDAVSRFRLVSSGAVGMSGLAPNGEVEDHLAPIGLDDPAIGAGTCIVSSEGRGAERTVVFDVTVGNYGNLPLADVAATLDLATTFAQAQSWQLLDATGTGLAVNATFDGDTDTDLLATGTTLARDAEGRVQLRVLVDPGNVAGPYTISVAASGTSPSGIVVTDLSQDGCNPDPDDDTNPGNNTVPSEVVFQLVPEPLPQPEIIPATRPWSLLLLGLLFLGIVWRRGMRG